MHWLQKLFRLPSPDRRLLLQALLLVGAIRLGLWFCPFRTVRRLLAKVTRPPAAARACPPASIDRVAWAVRTVSRCVPAANCLTQALATQILLSRRGIPASLHIGVAKDDANQLLAHAWVVSDGRTVVGGTALGAYTPLLVFEGEGLTASRGNP